MAARYYGVPIGGSLPTNVTEASSTTSAQFEFVIANTTASGSTKEQVLRALEAIKNYVIADTYPPA